jgi:hypothetical protein
VGNIIETYLSELCSSRRLPCESCFATNFCRAATSQVPDIQVGTPKRGKIHLINTTYATKKIRNQSQSLIVKPLFARVSQHGRFGTATTRSAVVPRTATSRTGRRSAPGRCDRRSFRARRFTAAHTGPPTVIERAAMYHAYPCYCGKGEIPYQPHDQQLAARLRWGSIAANGSRARKLGSDQPTFGRGGSCQRT